jgi:hypothetical protein
MRRSLLGLTAFATLMLFAACEGPEGPQGPAGQDGQDGVDGVDGVNAAETCSDCHADDTYLLAKQVQYNASQHAMGSTFARVDPECATCHTHEGFVDALISGAEESTAAAAESSPVNCRTCHLVHDTFSATDMALRTTAPVQLRMNDEEVDFSDGNVCARCHQPPPGDWEALQGETVVIAHPYWGPHHGPVAALLGGTGGYEYDGVTYASSAGHQGAEQGCVTCHMATPYGDQAGGHTMNIAYEDDGEIELNLEGCGTGTCHGGLPTGADEDALLEALELAQAVIWDDFQTNPEAEGYGEVDAADSGLLPDLKELLVGIGIMDETDHSVGNTSISWTPEVAGALWDYLFVLEDWSVGFHNFDYAEDLLESSIAAVEAFNAANEAVAAVFATSLHATRRGKATWYNAADGYGAIIGINYNDLDCKDCHDGTRLPDWTEPGCIDCHDNPNGGGPVAEATCFGCHTRQGVEKGSYSDVHRDAATPLECIDCHGSADMHGDGTDYESLFARDVTTQCMDCHDGSYTGATVPTGNNFHTMHADNIDCSACHMQSAVTCYNCHFASEVAGEGKWWYPQKGQAFKDWKFLVNFRNKVYPGNFQSVNYQGNTFVAFGPYYAHTISKNAITDCGDCHANRGNGSNAAIAELNANGTIEVAWWDDVDGDVKHIEGIVPVPLDYGAKLLFDFVDWDGTNWSFLEAGPDNFQMRYATPLTADQMDALGATGYVP